MSHTPGPWDVSAYEVGPGRTVRSNGIVLAHVFNEPEHTGANARLMAAAPQLLAACREAERVLSDNADWQIDSDGSVEESLDTVRAAIAEATGLHGRA